MALWLLLGLAGQTPMAAASVAAAMPVETAVRSSVRIEARLAELVNAYRRANGLPPVTLSPALTQVAEAHAADMAARPDGGATNDLGSDPGGGRCTMHSWSAGGRWTPVCYTPDHARAKAMWNKPREITGGAYNADGFEIAFWQSDTVTPEDALAGWIGSASHASLIRETGLWTNARWKAMGVGVAGHYAFVWFGKEPDVPAPKFAAR